MISTFPPVRCGIANFAANLTDALTTYVGCDVRAVDHAKAQRYEEKGNARLGGSSIRTEIDRCANAANECDLVILQHEFGLFPGEYGKDVLLILSAIKRPMLVILHTVWTQPWAGQQQVLEGVSNRVSGLVTLSDAAHKALISNYEIDPSKVRMILHGSALTPKRSKPSLDRHKPLRIATWGLLRPKKALHLVLQALSQLRYKGVDVEYRIVGQAHPVAGHDEKEDYVSSLRHLARRLGIQDLLRFADRYFDQEELQELTDWADIAILPYSSSEQSSSGVLVEALAAGLAVISTPFAHARELARTGAVRLVAHNDSDAIAHMLMTLHLDRRQLKSMTTSGATLSAAYSWPVVARRYAECLAELRSAVHH